MAVASLNIFKKIFKGLDQVLMEVEFGMRHVLNYLQSTIAFAGC